MDMLPFPDDPVNPAPMKRCPQCGEAKPLTEFSTHKAKASGRNSWCKTCCRAKIAAYRKVTPKPPRTDDMRAQERKRYQENKRKKICVECKSRPQEHGVLCQICRERHRLQKERQRSSGCRGCSGPRDSEKKHCSKCLAKCKEQCDRRRELGLCLHCGRPATPGRTACEFHKQKYREQRQREKDLVFSVYGGYCCACCGESNPHFLQIDHIDNDGYEHRKRIGRARLYRWLRKMKFPPGFQVLCSNCNFAKGHFGSCPHQRPPLAVMLRTLAALPMTY